MSREASIRAGTGEAWARFGATAEEWNDWRWQQANAVATEEEFSRHLALTPEEREGFATARRFRVGSTPYYLSLADAHRADCPVRMQLVPRRQEAEVGPCESNDPLGEELHAPAARVIHKYPDRALLLVTDRCAVYCRHCTRRRLVGSGAFELEGPELERAFDYLRREKSIRDLLLSGGDPLLLSDERLERLLGRLAEIPHIEMLRIGTRVPVANPMRITPALCALLRRRAPLFIVTHFNHPKECTAEAARACAALVDAGVPVENQSVLLRGLNSSARTLTALSHRLLAMRVRPYYLHQVDLAAGLGHLRTPLEAGVAILAAMRGHTSGLAIPHYAVDLPGGLGKITLQPEYRAGRVEGGELLRNYLGKQVFYPLPEARDCSCSYESHFFGDVEKEGER